VRVVADTEISPNVVHFEYRGSDPDGGLQPGHVDFGQLGRWANHRDTSCPDGSVPAPTGKWTAAQARSRRSTHTTPATSWIPITLQLNAGGMQLAPIIYAPGTYTAHLDFASHSCAGFDDVFASTTADDVTFTINADGSLAAGS
jgi:hypothetical protein